MCCLVDAVDGWMDGDLHFLLVDADFGHEGLEFFEDEQGVWLCDIV